MTPDFTTALVGSVAFGLAMLAYVGWRFSASDALVFAIMVGLFCAVLDFLSSFSAHNYEYPGQSKAWVFAYIFFGWIAMCGTCLFVADGILAKPGHDLLDEPRLIWQAPLVAATIAVVLDLFIDPVAVAAGYWVWRVQGTVYYGIPLLNYVGWFVLMLLAPLGWMLIVRRRDWSAARKAAVALGALIPLGVAAGVLSWLLNRAVAAVGWV